jgi:hypothetical protein
MSKAQEAPLRRFALGPVSLHDNVLAIAQLEANHIQGIGKAVLGYPLAIPANGVATEKACADRQFGQFGILLSLQIAIDHFCPLRQARCHLTGQGCRRRKGQEPCPYLNARDRPRRSFATIAFCNGRQQFRFNKAGDDSRTLRLVDSSGLIRSHSVCGPCGIDTVWTGLTLVLRLYVLRLLFCVFGGNSRGPLSRQGDGLPKGRQDRDQQSSCDCMSAHFHSTQLKPPCCSLSKQQFPSSTFDIKQPAPSSLCHANARFTVQ